MSVQRPCVTSRTSYDTTSVMAASRENISSLESIKGLLIECIIVSLFYRAQYRSKLIWTKIKERERERERERESRKFSESRIPTRIFIVIRRVDKFILRFFLSGKDGDLKMIIIITRKQMKYGQIRINLKEILN